MSGIDAALIWGTIIVLVVMPMIVAVWAVTFLKNNPPRDVLEASRAVASEGDTREPG